MGARTDMVELLPGSMKILDMLPDNPGTWLFHCHVNDHITAGMLALFTVADAPRRSEAADGEALTATTTLRDALATMLAAGRESLPVQEGGSLALADLLAFAMRA